MFKDKFLGTITNLASQSAISNIAYHFIQKYSTIFVLHRPQNSNNNIYGIEPAYLEQCLEYLRRHDFEFASLTDLLSKARNREYISPKTLCFTLDDGYRDQADLLIPILLKYDIEPLFFLISDLVSGNDWPWDSKVCWLLENTQLESILLNIGENQESLLPLDNSSNIRRSRHKILNYLKEVPAKQIPEYLQLISNKVKVEIPSQPPEEYCPMSWDNARILENQGVSFAPHSVSHNIFSRMPDIDVITEINESRQRLEMELESPESIFCYPTGRLGDFNSTHIDIMRDSGFDAAVSAIPGYFFHQQFENLRYSLPRIEIPGNFNTFLRYVSWIEAMRDVKNSVHSF